MRYLTTQFDFNEDTRCFVQEISTLNVAYPYSQLSNRTLGFTLFNTETGCSANFVMTHIDHDEGDTLGWHFNPAMDAAPEFLNCTVLIIND